VTLRECLVVWPSGYCHVADTETRGAQEQETHWGREGSGYRMNRLNAKDEVMEFLPPSRPAPTAVSVLHEGRRLVAYHEAGHALAGILFGQKFKYVTIEPDEERLGHCRFEPWGARSLSPFDHDHDTPRNRRAHVRLVNIAVYIDLAGLAAEHIAGERFIWETPDRPRSDISKAAERAEEITKLLRRPIEPRGNSGVFSKLNLPAEVERYLLRRLEETRLLLTLNREALDALAEALLERTRLSYRQARPIAVARRTDLDLEPWLWLTVRRNAASWNELNKEIDRLNREIEIKDLDQELQGLKERLGLRDATSSEINDLIQKEEQKVQDLREELRRRNAISVETKDLDDPSTHPLDSPAISTKTKTR
jgi:hypothetical protein